MADTFEKSVCVEAFVKLNKSATEFFETLCQAFSEHSLGQTAIFKWKERCEADRVSVEDDERAERSINNEIPEKGETL